MSNRRVSLNEQYLDGIGDAIRYANGTENTYTPPQMENAVKALKKTLGTKNISANGNYPASSDSLDGFSSVSVAVPNTYAAGDEGKVVDQGALVAQTSKNIDANGTHDTTKNNQVVVAVPNTYTQQDEGKVVENGALVSQSSLSVTANDTYDTTKKNQVVVNVPNTYAAGDEGKVVSNGALVAQSSSSVNQNGTVDTTLINSLTVAVAGSNGALAKLGGGSQIVALDGIYGPMGDASNDYIVPVSSVNQQNISIDTSEPFEIQFAFRLSAQPSSGHYILFGTMSNVAFPNFSMQIGALYTYIWATYTPDGGQATTTAVSPEHYEIPLDTDILVGVLFDGTDTKLWLNDGTNYEITLSNTAPYQVSAAQIGFASSSQIGVLDALAGLSEATVNIDKCYIKQNGTKIWGVTGGSAVLEHLTVNRNGTYTPPTGVDGFDQVTVNVPGGSIPNIKPISTSTNYTGQAVNIGNGYVAGPFKSAYSFLVIEDYNFSYLYPKWNLPFEIRIRAKYTSTYVLSMVLIGAISGFYYAPTIEFSPNGAGIWMGVSTDRNSWSYSLPFSNGTDVTMVENTWYDLTLAYDGTKVIGTVSDGTNTSTKEVSAATAPYYGSQAIELGGIAQSGNHCAYNVMIDLSKCYIKSNGNYVWAPETVLDFGPIVSIQSATTGTISSQDATGQYDFQSGTGRYTSVLRTQQYACHIWASDTSSAVGRAIITPNGEASATATYSLSNTFTFNDKTVYYYIDVGYQWNSPITSCSPVCNNGTPIGLNEGTAWAAAVAWEMIYGNI